MFIEKAHQPTIKKILAAVAPRQPLWKEVVEFLRERYSAKEDFLFYGEKYGWALRFRKGGKALASVYPTPGGFTVQVVLPAKDVEKSESLKLGRHVRQIIAKAHPYPEGRWLFVPIKSAKDVRDIQELIALKAAAGHVRK